MRFRKFLSLFFVISVLLIAVGCQIDSVGFESTYTETTAEFTDDKQEETIGFDTQQKNDISEADEITETNADDNETEYVQYKFRNKNLLEQHYKKHGIDMGFSSAEEYESAASDVINSPDARYKTEAEDGDGVYYIEATNEFVVLSTDGYIRTYFYPDSGKAYFDRQ